MIMKKKNYIAPSTTEYAIQTLSMIAASSLDETKDSQTVTPGSEEYNGEFTARRRGAWDDQEETDQY